MPTVRLSKWGNSVGLRLPKHVVDHLGLEAGGYLDVALEERSIVFRPVRRYDLEELVSGITEENGHGEFGWGEDAGKEQW
jgi:antitoxin MazE